MIKKTIILAAMLVGSNQAFATDFVAKSVPVVFSGVMGIPAVYLLENLMLCKPTVVSHKIISALSLGQYFAYSQAATAVAAAAFSETILAATVDRDHSCEVVDRNFAFNVIETAF